MKNDFDKYNAVMASYVLSLETFYRKSMPEEWRLFLLNAPVYAFSSSFGDLQVLGGSFLRTAEAVEWHLRKGKTIPDLIIMGCYPLLLCPFTDGFNEVLASYSPYEF